MLAALFLIVVLLQWLALLQLNRKRLYQKQEIRALEAKLGLAEERLEERTEQWQQACTTKDLSARRHEQTALLLHETKDYLNSIINSMPSVLIGVTPAGYVTHWNRAAAEITDRPESFALGYRINEVFPFFPHLLEWIEKAIYHDSIETHESVSLTLDDETHYFDITVFPLDFGDTHGAVVRVDDVTVRVRLENMMIQSEKMMSLGELAAGMAHEINNPLAAILHSVQNIQRRLQPGLERNREVARHCSLDLVQMNSYLEQREIIRFLNGIQEAGTQAAQIVRSMLEFSRSSSRKEKHVHIGLLLKKSIEFYKSTQNMNTTDAENAIDIQLNLEEPLPAINCNSLELQQVFVNLLKNADQAVSMRPPEFRKIQVSCRDVQDGIQIVFSDNGCGMDVRTMQHIFDPFFTTKDIGQGTGLGLSIAYFIITDRHKGQIDVASEPDAGTVFTIWLPRDI